MRRHVLPLFLLAVATAHSTAAQRIIETPWASPHATSSQTIGITDVEIDYHRPSVRERTIWGGLVPWEQVWRAGANDNTTIRVSHDVMVEGRPLPAGTYGLHMIPNQDHWTIAFSSNSSSWGSFSYDQAEDVLRVQVKAESAPHTEQLEYRFGSVDRSSAIAALEWEKLRVPFKIEVDTHGVVLAEAEKTLRHLPKFGWAGWDQAARYCLQNDVELERGLEWSARSLKNGRNAGNLSTRAGLLAKLGRGAEAAPIMLEAVEIGSENEINGIGYTFLQMGETAQAIKVFQTNVDRNPDSWNALDSLAEANLAAGNEARSRTLYEKALAMAPDDQKGRIRGVLGDL